MTEQQSRQSNQTEILVAIGQLNVRVEYISSQIEKILTSKIQSDTQLDEYSKKMEKIEVEVKENSKLRDKVNGALFTSVSSLLGTISILVYYIVQGVK